MRALASLKHSVRRTIDNPDGRHRSRKDTRRWCKGVVGREHRWVYVEDFRRANWYAGRASAVASVLACAQCGQHGRGPDNCLSAFMSYGQAPDGSWRPKLGPAF